MKYEVAVVGSGIFGVSTAFGPALGRLVSDIVEGAEAPSLTRLGRPALREPAPSPSAPIVR